MSWAASRRPTKYVGASVKDDFGVRFLALRYNSRERRERERGERERAHKLKWQRQRSQTRK